MNKKSKNTNLHLHDKKKDVKAKSKKNRFIKSFFHFFKIFKLITIADMITITNAIVGFLGITYILDGNYDMAFAIILLNVILDGLDGPVARLFKTKHNMGRYLDSMSDSVSFSFAPGILVYTIFYDKSTGANMLLNYFVVAVSILVVAMGIVRLTWFAMIDGGKLPYFRGLNTPHFTLTIISLIILHLKSNMFGFIFIKEVVLIIIFLMVWLLIISINFPKINTTKRKLFAGSIIILYLISFKSFPDMAIVMLSLLTLYVVIGPYMVQQDDEDE